MPGEAPSSDHGGLEAEVAGRKGFQAFASHEKKAGGGTQAKMVLRVCRELVVLPQVDKGASELDQALVKSTVRVAARKPEVFQHVVGLVIIAGVEAHKKARITRIHTTSGIDGQGLDKRGHALMLEWW